MKPETVLNIKGLAGREYVEKLRNEWVSEYVAIAKEFTNKEEICAQLSQRVYDACSYFIQRHFRAPIKGSLDVAYYDNLAADELAEDKSLDGEFPLGNEEDALFANDVFTLHELAAIQCGFHNLVSCGYYAEPNYTVLIRKGIVCECDGEWLDAANCYAGVPYSEQVQKREYACRAKAKQEGERLYRKAKKAISNGDEDAYFYLERAAHFENTEAETDLGIANAYGNYGCAKDISEAMLHLRCAARKGVVRACCAIVELYDSGERVDALEAQEMCAKAASLGNKSAKTRLKKGFDLRPLREIIQEKIDKGNVDALWTMVEQCRYENDQKAAEEYFVKAVEAEQVDALLEVANEFVKNGENHNDELADMYYKKAADKGSVKAMIALGDRALKLAKTPFWVQASEQGDLGELTETVKAEHKKQMIWYQHACESG